MLCLVTVLHCDPGGQTTKLDRLDRSLGGSRVGKIIMIKKRAADSGCFLDWRVISSSNASSFRPVNQKDLQPHLVAVTRGAGTKTNSCQRTTSDLSTAAVWPRLERSTRRAYEQQHPLTWPPDPSTVTLGTKKSLPTCTHGGKYNVFSLICFAQLNSLKSRHNSEQRPWSWEEGWAKG